MTHYPPVYKDRSRLWILLAALALVVMCAVGACASFAGHGTGKPAAPATHNAPTMAHPSGWPTDDERTKS